MDDISGEEKTISRSREKILFGFQHICEWNSEPDLDLNLNQSLPLTNSVVLNNLHIVSFGFAF